MLWRHHSRGDFLGRDFAGRDANDHSPAPTSPAQARGIHDLPFPNVSYTRTPGHPLVRIFTDPVSQPTGQFLAQQLYKSTGWQFVVAITTNGATVRNGILLTTVNANTNLATAEGYELTVAPDSVVIRAPGTAGVFYGVQSLLQLLPPQIAAPLTATNVAWTVPCVYIYDQPRFPWRGVMLDCARHFVDKQSIKQLLDAMATVKLNTFHLAPDR